MPTLASAGQRSALAAHPGRLRGVAGFIGAGGVLAVVHRLTGWGVPCPFRSLTGWLCPLCGGTHVGSEILRGDVAAAWAANPVVFTTLALVGALALCWLAELVRGRRLGPLDRVEAWVATAPSRAWWLAGVSGAALFTVARNLG